MMMSREQIGWAQLAASMTKSAKRKADDSDSDESIEQLTNRGNKLKKKAKFVREGQLAVPSGPEVYKKTITFYHDLPNGQTESFERDVISTKPVFYDEDGDEIDQELDIGGDTSGEVADLYPYSNVRIEEIFAPLVAVEMLANHPTLSGPFTSNTLTELTRHASEMIQKEKAYLWRMRHLFTKLSGDDVWVPCGILETEADLQLFDNGRIHYRDYMTQKDRAPLSTATPSISASLEDVPLPTDSGEVDPDETMELVDTTVTGVSPMAEIDDEGGARSVLDMVVPNKSTSETHSSTKKDAPLLAVTSADETSAPLDTMTAHEQDVSRLEVPQGIKDAESHDMQNGNSSNNVNDPETQNAERHEDEPAPRRMRTRAQAQAVDSSDEVGRSTTPESNESYVHPVFLVPHSAIPDRDVGLPQLEAEETRRLLQLYIQKQEQICRGVEELYLGLLKADRLRHTVMSWSKAEGHTHENGNGLSDGEDWYDLEEWGLTEDLKKGQDEEEEDAATTAKKTRTRRQ